MDPKDLVYDWNARDAAFDYTRKPVVLNDDAQRGRWRHVERQAHQRVLKQRLTAEDAAELLRAIVARDHPRQRPQPLTFSSCQYDRPPGVVRHEVLPSRDAAVFGKDTTRQARSGVWHMPGSLLPSCRS